MADVVVIGAGAAGLAAATFAAREGARVVLLEKNLRPGLKILISGGGRCNLTTTRTDKDLEQQFGTRRGRWLRHALRAFPPAALRHVVEAAGVPLHEEDLEKIFPVSGKAHDVLDAWLRMARDAGVELVTEAPMLALERGFAVTTPKGTFTAPRVVLAVGGKSYPRTGATGDGYAACAALGHTIVPTVPALAPLAVDADWVHELSGITLPLPLTLVDKQGKVIRKRHRPVLFTHKGLSGPGAMDLAGDIEERDEPCRLRIDFAPEWTREDLDAQLVRAGRESGRTAVANALPREIPERVRRTIVAGSGVDPSRPVAELGKAARHKVVANTKGIELTVERSLGFKAAEVTRGGVALGEVDARTMASKLVPGLYLCGEILDVDGPIGGFNFQAAFATGRLAGLAAARN